MQKVVLFFKKYRYNFLLYLLSWCALILLYILIKLETGNDFPVNTQSVLAFLSDGFLLLCPYWLLPNRYKWLIILPVFLLSVFFIVNIWYYRFWGNFLPTTSLLFSGNFNGLLLNSVRGVSAWFDVLFIIPSLLILAFIVLYNKSLVSERPLKTSRKVSLFCLSIFISFVTYTLNLEKIRRWTSKEMGNMPTYVQTAKNDFIFPTFNPITYLNRRGLIIYGIKFVVDYADIAARFRPLEEHETTEILQYLGNLHANTDISQFNGNSTKNIIFIIVESLNSYVINLKVNGREVTPFINSLLRDEGTIYNLNIRNQVADGGSGDGQFIYNTGLLPLKGSATPLVVVPRISLKPLADNFSGHHNLTAVFADDAMSWNQNTNFVKYGFKNIYSQLSDDKNVLERGSDGAMFDKALQLIKASKEPFLLELITISMHTPFRDPGVKESYDWLKHGNLSKNEFNYLRMTAYFDEELKNFIQQLKELDLYDDTILIMASDHSQNLALDPVAKVSDNDIPIVFIATNTGVTKEISRPAGQVDVYPTILDITSRQEAAYRGIGVSMLDSLNSTTVNPDETQKISDLIIIGDYFSK